MWDRSRLGGRLVVGAEVDSRIVLGRRAAERLVVCLRNDMRIGRVTRARSRPFRRFDCSAPVTKEPCYYIGGSRRERSL